MRKIMAILGIILVVMIFMSGTATAAWVYVEVVDHYQCTNPYNIEGASDYNDATLGQNGLPNKLGTITLNLTTFTVFASSTVREGYDVWIGEDPNVETMVFVDTGVDDNDYVFTTPSTPDKSWQYILMHGLTGSTGAGDTIYGPDIDAVGWNT
jgi:hypothetical protein